MASEAKERKLSLLGLALAVTSVISGVVAAIGLGGIWWGIVLVCSINAALWVKRHRDRYGAVAA